MLKKAPFESDLLRDSVEKHVGKDFWSIFEACAQTPNLDFEATLWCFLWFFKNRVVFARVGLLVQKNSEKV